LLAQEDTKDIAAIITPVLDEFPATLKLDLDSRRAVIGANARAFVADTALDEGLRGLFSRVLALVNQNRKRDEFKTLFSSHIGDVVRHALKRQLEVTSEIVKKLALKIFPDDLRTEQTKALNALIERGKAVLADTQTAAVSRVEARLDIQTWKQEANAAQLTAYGQLLAIAAKSGRNKAWAEGFFPKAGTASGAAEEETSEETSGAEGLAEATPNGDEGSPT
jgi:hypothetical protein